MKERPILFSAPMVRALLAGTKTQTRRIIKLQTGDTFDERALIGAIQEWRPVFDKVAGRVVGKESVLIHCPYGVRGDRLWVRETFGSRLWDPPGCEGGRKPQEGDPIVYRADPAAAAQWGAGLPSHGGFVWRPAIHMPRWASRLTLTVTDVRRQGLQKISEEDAVAEGVDAISLADVPRQAAWDRRQDFSRLWDSLHAPPHAWAENPEIIALTFTVERRNIDAEVPT